MSKILDNFIKYRFLLMELVKKGIKLRYRRSYLGVIWTLLEPLLMMIVLTFVFGTLLGRGDHTYPVYILCGRLVFQCFSSTTKSCLKSIRSNAGMIKKVYVPKYLYPLSEALYNYVIFLISLIVLVIVSCVLGVYPSFKWLLSVLPLIQVFLLSYGVGMVLATIGVFFRDMEYLWTVLTTLLMYMSAIFYYPSSFLGDSAVELNFTSVMSAFSSGAIDWKVAFIYLNPVYCIITNFRNCIIGDAPFDLAMFAYSTAFSIICIVIGVYFFFKKQNKFILEI